jgi:hypothetical protein
MKVEKQNKKDKLIEVESRIGNGHSEKRKLRPDEPNNSPLLADSIWNKTYSYDHNMLIYLDLPTYRKIYSESAKQALDNNEVAFLVTTYDSFDRIKDSLTQAGISVSNETEEGNLIILDALKAYQIDTYGAAKFALTLTERAERDGKAGVFALTEMGSFFIAERIATLLEYETSLQQKFDIRLKAICTYHKDDFSALPKEQQEIIVSAHNRLLP